MHLDSEIEHDIIARHRQAVAEAERRGYERGVRDTMDKIQSLVMSDTNVTTSGSEVAAANPAMPVEAENAEHSDNTTTDRKRAPKGLVRKVVKRALAERPGLTPTQLVATAQNDLEKMIRASSYRSELRKGRKAGLYRENDGKWFLVEKEKAEGKLGVLSSAFGITTERG